MVEAVGEEAHRLNQVRIARRVLRQSRKAARLRCRRVRTADERAQQSALRGGRRNYACMWSLNNNRDVHLRTG